MCVGKHQNVSLVFFFGFGNDERELRLKTKASGKSGEGVFGGREREMYGEVNRSCMQPTRVKSLRELVSGHEGLLPNKTRHSNLMDIHDVVVTKAVDGVTSNNNHPGV